MHGKENPVDLLTNHFNHEEIFKHFSILGFRIIGGSAGKSLSMNTIVYFEARTQTLIRKQKDLWRRYPIGGKYGNETSAKF